MKKHIIYLSVIGLLVFAMVVRCNRTPEIDTSQIDKLKAEIQGYESKIEALKSDIADSYHVIDSLKNQPEKIRTVYKHEIKLIDGFSHAQTSEYLSSAVKIDCDVDMEATHTILNKDTVTMFHLPEMKCFATWRVERDKWHDLANVYEGLNVQYEDVILNQSEIISTQDTIIMKEREISGTWEHKYRDEIGESQEQEKQKRFWRGVAVGSVILNIFLLCK